MYDAISIIYSAANGQNHREDKAEGGTTVALSSRCILFVRLMLIFVILYQKKKSKMISYIRYKVGYLDL